MTNSIATEFPDCIKKCGPIIEEIKVHNVQEMENYVGNYSNATRRITKLVDDFYQDQQMCRIIVGTEKLETNPQKSIMLYAAVRFQELYGNNK